MGPAFSVQMSGQIPGCPAATLVMSRNPPAARRNKEPFCSAPVAAAFIKVAATRCGTCETTATRRSWSGAERTSTSAPERGHHALQGGERVQIGLGRGGQDPDGPFEEVRVGPPEPDLFRAGHGVPADESRMVGRLHDGGLDPADVGHDRVGPAPRGGEDPTGLVGHGRRRHGDEDDAGVEVVPDLSRTTPERSASAAVRRRRRCR